jgi:hypothetical protein
MMYRTRFEDRLGKIGRPERPQDPVQSARIKDAETGLAERVVSNLGSYLRRSENIVSIVSGRKCGVLGVLLVSLN